MTLSYDWLDLLAGAQLIPPFISRRCSQNHLREQMEPTFNSRLGWLIHLLTQVVLTSWLSRVVFRRCAPQDRHSRAAMQ
jgi:hypothetical protein